jgi:hypothetical protein
LSSVGAVICVRRTNKAHKELICCSCNCVSEPTNLTTKGPCYQVPDPSAQQQNSYEIKHLLGKERNPHTQQIDGSVREEELCSPHAQQGRRGKITRSKEVGLTSTSSKVSTPHI